MNDKENPVKVKDGFYYVGVLDSELKVFDIIMETKYGSSYNSYLLIGEKKTALIETVKVQFYSQMLSKIKKALNGRNLDYIIHNHTEPDHSGSSAKLLKEYPEATIVASENGIAYLHSIWNFEDEQDKKIKTLVTDKEVKDLDLGGYTLHFKSAPFLHWPDSIFTYCPELKTIFTCDVLGSHYAAEKVFDSNLDEKERIDYDDSFKYYFDCIFGPFKNYIQNGLKIINQIKKEQGIEIIGTSHGPILTEKELIEKLLVKYDEWSTVEKKFEDQVTILSVSAYGYTKKMANSIKKGIESQGIKVLMYDPEIDSEKDIHDGLRSSKGVLFGSPTILSDALPNIYKYLMYPHINPIKSLGQIAGSFGSYGWTGEGTENLDGRLQQLKLKLPLDPLKFRFKPTKKELKQCEEFGSKFARAVKGEEINERTQKETKRKKKTFSIPNDGKLRVWRCIICGERVTAYRPPDQCPACSQTGDIWVCEKVIEDKIIHSKYEGTICVVGAGSAGVQAVRSIRERNSVCKVILFSEEKGMPYYRPSLTKKFERVFSGKNENWMEENKVQFVNEKVVEANDEKKELKTTSGKVFNYDKLIIATGSTALNNFPQNKNTFVIYTEDDVNSIIKYLDDFKGEKKANVGIVGAGLLGIEISELLLGKLKEKVGKITMIEMKKSIMPRQFDEQGGNLYVKMLENAGVDIITETNIKELKINEQNLATHIVVEKTIEITKDLKHTEKTDLPVDIVLISTGTAPNLELPKQLGVEFCKGRGNLVRVNEFMQTSKEHIYACGNIAQHGFFCIPNYLMALQKGIVAGFNAVEIEKKFKRDIIPAFTLDSFERNAFSSGAINTKVFLSRLLMDGEDNDSAEYIKLGFKPDKKDGKLKLCGALYIARKGEQTPGPSLISALSEKITMQEATEMFLLD